VANNGESALHVLPGCPVPEPPDPAQSISARRRVLSRRQYVDGILNADRSILSQAITLVESSRPAHRDLAQQIVEDCLSSTGNSLRLGITGSPGAGKSSIIEALGSHLVCDLKQNVAVLAIDPSSDLTGGSILGDKTRMTALAASPLAFIRPSPSRGGFGGVAERTREAILLCEAAGYRNILVETVGVGQAEIAVHEMVDCLVLILLAQAGDELQGIKRGVMEWLDVAVINKADGANVDAAGRFLSDVRNALQFFPPSPSGWTSRALLCSAHTGLGISALWDSVLEHASTTRQNGWFARNRRQQTLRWMHSTVEQELRRFFQDHTLVRSTMEGLERDVPKEKPRPFKPPACCLTCFQPRSHAISPGPGTRVPSLQTLI
jgi:LAO/AO transport system kinase